MEHKKEKTHKYIERKDGALQFRSIDKPDGGTRRIIIKSEKQKIQASELNRRINSSLTRDINTYKHHKFEKENMFKNIFTIGPNKKYAHILTLSTVKSIWKNNMNNITDNQTDPKTFINTKYKQFGDVIFLDISNAYDSVPHDRLLVVLKMYLPEELFDRVKKMYDNVKYVMVDKPEKVLSYDKGLFQGCVLSRTLFGIYLGHILNIELKLRYNSCAFVDDIVMWSNDYYIIYFKKVQEVLLKYGLTINKNKTRISPYNYPRNYEFLKENLISLKKNKTSRYDTSTIYHKYI